VVAAGTGWDGIWMPERHVAVHLSRTVPVLWVDPPYSWMTPLRNRATAATLRQPRLRPVTDEIMRLTSLTVPGLTRPGLRAVVQAQVRHAVRGAVRRLGGRVLATIVASPDNLLRSVPGARSVFYGTDDFVAGAELMGIDRGWLERCERRQLRTADRVIAVSDALREHWAPLRPDIAVIPNGCDYDRLAATDEAPPPADVRLPRPIAGFLGHLSERIDLTYLEAVADRGISLLLVGPRQPTFQLGRMEALLARPNVQWVGAKPFPELPSYLGLVDVGLTPYADSAFNRASFPLKTLEYLAAGRPVVASDLPAARMLATDLVAITRTAADFAAATEKALAAGLRAPEVAARRAFAAQHSWARRTADIAALAGLAEPSVGGPGPVTARSACPGP
jgi:glycosyltransferase involved in cell wall biosynthesis